MSEPRTRGYRRAVTSACAGFAVALGLAAVLLGGPEATAATSTLGGTETSPPTGYLRVEQDNAAVAYSGNWTTQPSTSSCSYSGGTAVEATAANAQATFTFTGTAVRWIGYQDSASGIADVYIDGVFQTSVDTYSLTPVCQSLIFSASGLASGSHTLTITATGTQSLLSLGTGVWVDAFDFQPQPSVTLTAPAGGATVSGTTTVSADATESGGTIASVQFKLDGADLGTADTTAPYSVSWNTAGAANGSHTLTAVATDSAGNTATSAAVTVTVLNDTSPPVITLTAPADGATVSGSVSVSANASDTDGSITGVQFKLDGADLGTKLTAAPYSVTWNTTGTTNGSHTLTAVATDTGGNNTTSSPVTVTVSNSAPSPTVVMTAPASGATVSGTVSVSANASESGGTIASVQFKLDGADLGTAVTAAPYSVSWNTTTATNGSHTLTAVATDSGGHSATATAVTVTVSNGSTGGAPTVTMTTPANGAKISGTVTVSASASESGGSIARVQFELDGANLDTAVTAAPYSVSWNTTTATNGSHTLTAVATDSTGHSASATAVTVTVSNGSGGDTTPPTVALTSPAGGATVSGSVTVFANASDDTSVASVQFTLDGADLGAAVTSSPYHVSWDTATASNGSHTLSAVATDSAGNTASASPVAVIVANGPATTTTRIQEDDPSITYSGGWIQTSESVLSGGTANESNTANATATLKFTGVAATWISYRCACTAGIAEVSVDGGAPTPVDTYAATPQAQAPVFTASGLSQGPHTLKITVTGNSDPAGNSAYVVVDAFDITDDPPPPQGTPPPPGKSGGGTFGFPVLGLLLAAALIDLARRRSHSRKGT